VADPRTSSVVVTASKDLMDQIGAMVEQLDVDSTKVQHVHVFHLDNADAQEVMPVLQSMFQKNNSSPNNNSSTQTSPLMSRTQQNESSSTSGTSSTSSGLGGNSRNLGGSSTPQF
jgi:type II secretory pathway component GspD/PulD (secretin)